MDAVQLDNSAAISAVISSGVIIHQCSGWDEHQCCTNTHMFLFKFSHHYIRADTSSNVIKKDTNLHTTFCCCCFHFILVFSSALHIQIDPDCVCYLSSSFNSGPTVGAYAVSQKKRHTSLKRKKSFAIKI